MKRRSAGHPPALYNRALDCPGKDHPSRCARQRPSNPPVFLAGTRIDKIGAGPIFRAAIRRPALPLKVFGPPSKKHDPFNDPLSRGPIYESLPRECSINDRRITPELFRGPLMEPPWRSSGIAAGYQPRNEKGRDSARKQSDSPKRRFTKHGPSIPKGMVDRTTTRCF